ncbi:expressed unknown protein [Seminavis robusta]|uniref:Uncharacterized protein n=1 Tax=Seminavis robusta TaxID=568900 RepID=A0A9N8HE89_9STRA|nr:expressed unknown protein [Seminavis robusta]|eukprot:Sro293_g109970.1 n/a (168) ;mRNA; r:50211-50714
MSGEQKVLNALAALIQQTGKEEIPKPRVATTAQISKATFPSLLSRMKKKGLIDYGSSNGTLILTETGSEKADPLDVAGSDEEHHEKIKQELKGKARAIFEFLSDGEIKDKQEVMEAVECTNPKTFAPLLSRELKKKGYICYPSKGKVQLTKECFPISRRGGGTGDDD